MRIRNDCEDLQQRLERIEPALAALKLEVAEAKERLANAPTAFQVVSWFIGINVALVALTFTIARVM